MKWLLPLLFCLLVCAACDDAAKTLPDTDTVVTDDTTDLPDASDEDAGSDALIEEEPDEDIPPFDGDFERVVVIPKEGIELTATIDITGWDMGEIKGVEKLSFPAPADGNTVKLFGEKMIIEKASVPFEYDKHTALFFPGEFSKGDPLTIEVRYTFSYGAEMGMRLWLNSGTGETVVGPFTEPYFTPYWLIVPQSPFTTDKDNDANVPVEKVDLSVVVPDENWTVMGPSVIGTHEGTTWNFVMDTPMPFYALSFAASQDHTFFSAGTTKSGVEIWGAGFASEIENLQMIYPVGVTTVDWMEEHIGPYEFGDKVGLVSIPDFGGGMEHVGVIYMGTDVLAEYDSGVFVTVHEIVHNWWGDNVRFADWPDFWVAEGFDEWTTNYNLMAAIESADDFADRRAQYRSVASILCTADDAVSLRFDEDLDFMTLGMQLQSPYYYGSAFLEMVNKRLGRDFDGMEFLPLLKLWFEEKHLTTVTTEDFLAFLIAHTSDTADSTDYWQALFNDWVYQAPCPSLSVGDYAYSNGTVSFTISHDEGAQQLDQFAVILVTPSGPVSAAVTVMPGEQNAVEIVSAEEPTSILIDPEWYYVFALDTTGWDGPLIDFIGTPNTAVRRAPLPDASLFFR
ncbi:MAG TPA: M1 family aminopeptidase [bacterium]|nr:M1 family aminopeptidase [bacterium]